MIPAQFHVDILDELGQILPNYTLLVPSFVIDELEWIKKRSKGKARTEASIALKITQSPEINIINVDLRNREKVDDALLRISNVLCTNDIGLRRRAREKGIAVIYLRQKNYLAVDGYIGL